MKKILTLILSLTLTLSLTACGLTAVETSTTMTATVINIYGENYLVEPVEGSQERSSADRINVPMRNLNPALEVELGDLIEVTYDGTIQETYPAAIPNVQGIKVIQEAEAPHWGLTLTTKDVTPTGLTLVMTQSGDGPTGELQCGIDFSLEVQKNGLWEDVPYAIDPESVAWTAEAYGIPANGSVELIQSWTHYYGELPFGHYRLCKPVMDFRQTGDYDAETYHTEFTIP